MGEKETTMKVKVNVDLQCQKCYKKVKKILCKFPQIRDQVYDEKNNIVTIKVVCCSPEKIRDELCCKGCGIIKCIEIVVPKPRTPQRSPTRQPPPPPPPPPPPVTVQVCVSCVPCCQCRPGGPCLKPVDRPRVCCGPCSEGRRGGPCVQGCGGAAEPKEPKEKPPPPTTKSVPPPCPQPAVPIGGCCGPCSEGRPGGPCFQGCGAPPPCYDGCYGRPVCDSYGGGRPCYVSRCEQYLCEENPSGCSIM